jgi:transposase
VGCDGLRSYGAYARCRHALCNVHHLRELTFVEETVQKPWATKLKGLLLEMKAAAEQARTRGEARLDAVARDAFVACYEELMAEGLAANPPPERPPGQKKGRQKQSPTRNLLERPWMGQEAVLAFLDDLAIPFGNNQAEQDLRMLKVQQKIAGCFRADSDSAAFARIRGSCATLHKQGVRLLAALHTVFTGQPLYPTLD